MHTFIYDCLCGSSNKDKMGCGKAGQGSKLMNGKVGQVNENSPIEMGDGKKRFRTSLLTIRQFSNSSDFIGGIHKEAHAHNQVTTIKS